MTYRIDFGQYTSLLIEVPLLYAAWMTSKAAASWRQPTWCAASRALFSLWKAILEDVLRSYNLPAEARRAEFYRMIRLEAP